MTNKEIIINLLKSRSCENCRYMLTTRNGTGYSYCLLRAMGGVRPSSVLTQSKVVESKLKSFISCENWILRT